MGHQHLYSHALFPVLAYATVCFGSFQGWACMARFRARRTQAGRMWLALAALALGSALWGMHMITMLGYDVPGTKIRHDALLTQLAALVCVGSTMLGLLLAEARRTWLGLLIAGSVMTGGLTGAHLVGMAALDAPAEFSSSVGIALIAAVLAAAGVAATLWLTVTVDTRPLAVGASLLTAAVLCTAQYTDLAAMTVTSTRADGHAEGGLSGPTLTLAVAAVLTLMVLMVAFNLYITPVRDVHDTPAPLVTYEMPKYLLADNLYVAEAALPAEPAGSKPTAVTAGDDQAVEAGPVLRISG